MVTASIWKDTYYTSDSDILAYYVKTEDDKVIFAGKAYRIPSDDTVKIKINSICSNYLNNDLGPLLEANKSDDTKVNSAADDALRIFYLYKADDNTLLETYKFLYDWSYDFNFQSNLLPIMSRPINRRKAANMYSVYTSYRAGRVTNTLAGRSYEVVPSCNAEFGMYYLNSYGGWDAFLFEGKTIKKDTIKQYNSDRSFDNSSNINFEKYRYVSEITTSYELHTGWLNDVQSENFSKNLISSNRVYLHDLKANKIFAAVITDSNVVYQTIRNNNGKMAVYTVNVEVSQNKLRK